MIANKQILVEHNLQNLCVAVEELCKVRSSLDEPEQLVLEDCAIKLNRLIKRQILKLDIAVVNEGLSKIGEIYV